MISPDLQAALNAALMRAQMQQQAPAPSHHTQVAGAQAMMQNLAKAIANQRRPVGQARVFGHPAPPAYPHPPVDGGYSGAGIWDPSGHLVARAGFGPHPVPPQMLMPGMRPALGGQYVE